MTMTYGELAGHADLLQEDLDRKRRQVRNEDHTPSARAGLLTQINALADRVDEIRTQCEGHTTAELTPLASPALA